MFGKVIESVIARFALRALKKGPVYRAAIDEIRGTLANKSTCLGKIMSQSQKDDLAAQIISEVIAVVTAPDPIMANRERLVNYVLQLAKFLVLVLAPLSDEEEDVTGLRGRPGITGELRAYIPELAQKDEFLKEHLWAHLDNPTSQDIDDLCDAQYQLFHFMTTVFNRTRVALGDHHPSPEKDWYRPFVAAMCACEEHNYRKAIGLPDILAQQDNWADLAALTYLTFAKIVMSDAKYPNFEWEERYKRENA